MAVRDPDADLVSEPECEAVAVVECVDDALSLGESDGEFDGDWESSTTYML